MMDSDTERLGEEWLERIAQRGSGPDAAVARQELRFLHPIDGVEQGFRDRFRSVIGSLARTKWFAPFGFMAAERFVNRALRQVSSYLSDDEIRRSTKERVHALLRPSTRVVIAHSLGSVVAYEVAHELRSSLPLLLTLGSPLGLQSVVLRKVRPQPPRFPPAVRVWHNVASRADIVAAEPNLRPIFEGGMPESAVFESHWEVDNGAEPHRADYYLNKAVVGRIVATALS